MSIKSKPYSRAAVLAMAAFVFFLSGVASIAPTASQAATRAQSSVQPQKSPRILPVEKWREDLQFLVEKVETAHRFPFSKITKETFDGAAADHPDSFEAHIDLGEAYLGAGKKAEATKSLEKGLSLKPGDARAKELLEKLK